MQIVEVLYFNKSLYDAALMPLQARNSCNPAATIALFHQNPADSA